MDALEAASRSADPIGYLAAQFMLDAATYERGGELGYEGIDFYHQGRGGALGDVPGAVVAAAFVFFNPDTVVAAWERARAVSTPRQGAQAFIACGHEWAEAKLPDDVDLARLAELAGKLAAASSPAGAPLFAAWHSMEEPVAPKPLALQRMHVLRELRGALHGAAVLAQGLTPLEALMVKTPFMAQLFGYSDPLPDGAGFKAQWEAAEAATNLAMARAFAGIEPAERAEFVELAAAAHGGI